MIKNKLFLILVFTIFLTSLVASVPLVKINDKLIDYTNNASDNSVVEVSGLGGDCNVGTDYINISIASDATSSFTFPIYCNLDRNYSGYFSVDFNTNTPSAPIPDILVNTEDTVILTYSGVSANLIVDNVNSVVGTFSLNSLGTKVGNYYKGNVSGITLTGFSDNHAGIKNYIAYIVPVASIDSYKTEYTKKVTVSLADYNGIINLALPTGVSDGNYYVVMDLEDNAGNMGVEASVKTNGKIIYVDNTAPQITSFNIGSYATGTTYYVPTTTNILTMGIEDTGVGIRAEPLYTQLDRLSVKLTDYNSSFEGFYFDFNNVDYNVTGSYEFALTDLLGNDNNGTFIVSIDSTVPTTPTIPTLTRAVDNNITIANWGASTDAGSGFKEYQIYRSTSSFIEVTTQTLICTVGSSATKTCLDSTSKDDDTRYYYGVAGVDNAGNKSTVSSASVKTGPELTVDIDFAYSDYVKDLIPEILLEYGSDVNAVRLSCNGTTFSTWAEVNNSPKTYDTFNITSGNGCNTTQGDKTIYVEARSEDDPFTITRKSIDIRYDSVAPTIPSNVVLLTQTNGSVKITWNDSTDVNGSGVDEYRIYYSESDNVTTSSPHLVASDTEYIYSPNKDATFYFKIASLDRIGNESVLSSGVSGTTRRFGPSFTFNANPKNLVDDVYYIKKGNVVFTITSTQELKQIPFVRVKIGTAAYQNVPATYNNLITTASYDFQTSGDGILEITGINAGNESSTDTFEFLVDANAPVFDTNYIFSDENKYYSFSINNFSEDIFRVQYLLNNTEEICFINDSNNNYLCEFDSSLYEDGAKKMYVLGSDLALNYTTKIVDFEINNVDEQLILKQTLLSDIIKNKNLIENTLLFLDGISLSVASDITTKFDIAKAKITEGASFEDANNFTSAIESYTYAEDLLLEIIDLLPKENILKSKTISIDFRNNGYDFNVVILDQNTISDNLLFYDVNNLDLNQITISRELSVFEMSNLDFYSSVLTFDNNTDSDLVISYIEFVPKEFAKLAEHIYFDRNVSIVDNDPIILYNLTIPKHSSVSTRYISKESVTSFDALTKFDLLSYNQPLLLVGVVNKDVLNLSTPMFSSKSLFLISVVFLVIIIVLILIWMLISSRKRKDDVFTSLDSKGSINQYLGDKLDNKNNLENKNNSDSSKSDIEKKERFDNNYEFILNAVKRENK